jgi:putative protease
MFKPELLLPAGSVENFVAALEGGADAVYFGLQNFNARARAKNFSFNEAASAIAFSHSRNKKVYITLNTVVKNTETLELIKTVDIISQLKPDAVIVQDFGTINLIRNLYPHLVIHASTQMGFNNVSAIKFLKKNGVKRVILSRELTMKEIEFCAKHSDIELEIFVHGALCYSFSGKCLFSSYYGGFSANRGKCAQVCRRQFISENQNITPFSLKDYQLIDFIPSFSELKISSLKVEGRLKNSDYVFSVAKAYRMAIDNHSKIEEAKEILKTDFSRPKMQWFVGKDLKNSVSELSGTGVFAGVVLNVNSDFFDLSSSQNLEDGYQLRIRTADDKEGVLIKINKLNKINNDVFRIFIDKGLFLKPGDKVYVSAGKVYKPVKLKIINKKFNFISNQRLKLINDKFKQKTQIKTNEKRMEIFIRVSKVEQLQNVNLNKIKTVIFSPRKLDVDEELFKICQNLPANVAIYFEIPAFISSLKETYWQKKLLEIHKKTGCGFSLSNISQLEIIPQKSLFLANENIYLFNDIAIDFIRKSGFKEYIYPFENDYPNLITGKDRNGIVPVYFYPELFYSRQPIKLKDYFADFDKRNFRKYIRHNFTVICPEKPVSITQNIQKLKEKGFSKFLIDLKYESSLENLKNIFTSVLKSHKIEGTDVFNFKREMK